MRQKKCVKDKREKAICLLLVSILFALVITACGASEAEGTQNETVNNTDIKEETEFDNNLAASDSEVKETFSEEINKAEPSFISDTPEEQWNVYGNNFANLSQFSNPSGRMTAQGDWIYYYSRGAIYKKQGMGPEILITNASDAYSLNIIGDWIYYKEGESVYKVRTDGADKEIIFDNVSSNIFIVGDEICYISKENASATVYNYILKIYNTNSLTPIYQAKTGESPLVLVGFRPDLKKVFGYYEEYIDKASSGTFAVVEIDYAAGNLNPLMTSSFETYGWSTDDEFFVMMRDDLIVSNAFKQNSPSGENIIQIYSITNQSLINEIRHDWFRKIVTANIWDENIICTPDSNSFKLYAVDASAMKYKFNEENKHFLEEAIYYREIYVLGDYVYYTIADTGEYSNRPIFRIKTDGTDWAQFHG